MNYLFWIWMAQCFLMGSGSSAKDETSAEVNAVLGGEVTFPVQIRDGFEIEKNTCTFKGALIAEMTPGNNYTVRDKRFVERLSAVDENGSLKIRNLRTEDCGLYVTEIFNKKTSTEKETKRYELKVFSHVEAHITTKVTDSANGTCLITFNCTVNNITSVSYSWSGVKAEPSVGPVMSLSLTENASNLTVCCTVKNPVSKASACVLPREHCFPDTCNQTVDTCNTTPQRSSIPGYIIAVIGVVILGACAAVIGGILYYLKSSKGRKDQADISTVYAHISNSNKRSEGGNHYTRTEENNTKPNVKTIYAAVQTEDRLIPNGNTSTSEKDATTTLYAKLQKPQSNSTEMSTSLLDSGCDSGSPYDEVL